MKFFAALLVWCGLWARRVWTLTSASWRSTSKVEEVDRFSKACFFSCFLSGVGLSAADGLIGYHFSVYYFSHQNVILHQLHHPTSVVPSSSPKSYHVHWNPINPKLTSFVDGISHDQFSTMFKGLVFSNPLTSSATFNAWAGPPPAELLQEMWAAPAVPPKGVQVWLRLRQPKEFHHFFSFSCMGIASKMGKDNLSTP